MNEELKPCPFCGGEPNLTHDDYVHDDLRPMPVVECKSCSAWVRAEDWNRRAQAQQAAQIAELEQQRGGVVLPERNELRADSDIEDAWQRGWNACLDGVSRLNPPRKFRLGDPVRKTKGSQWSGRVVGFYSTEQTPDGYAVESFTEKGSVQIYPGSALEPCEEPGECVAVPVELLERVCADRSNGPSYAFKAIEELRALLAQSESKVKP